jgi:hypothetical protein
MLKVLVVVICIELFYWYEIILGLLVWLSFRFFRNLLKLKNPVRVLW